MNEYKYAKLNRYTKPIPLALPTESLVALLCRVLRADRCGPAEIPERKRLPSQHARDHVISSGDGHDRKGDHNASSHAVSMTERPIIMATIETERKRTKHVGAYL